MAVNLAAAGPLVAPGVEWLGTRRGRPGWGMIAIQLTKWSILAAAVGFGLGLLALAAVTIWRPDGQGAYFSAVKQVATSRWWFTAGEIAFYFACLAGYVMKGRPWQRFRPGQRALAVAAGTNLLYHFPALFTILSIIVERPALHGQPLTRQLYYQLLLDPETLARVLHVWLASFAVAGLALAAVAVKFGRQAENDDPKRAAALGGRISLTATLLQVPVGVWVLMTLPEPQQHRAMGGDLLCTALFGLSVFAALGLMHQLAMLAIGDATGKRIRIAAILMAGVVLLMTATLHLARAS